MKNKLAYLIKRFRVNRGFTVHSPFAFRFIKLVVRETLPYYDFRTIRDPYDRLLYRTAVYFNPSTVAVDAPGAENALAVIRRALPSARIVDPSEAEFIYAATPHPTAAVQFLAGSHTVADAVTFNLPRATIAVRRHGVPPASYPLSLP